MGYITKWSLVPFAEYFKYTAITDEDLKIIFKVKRKSRNIILSFLSYFQTGLCTDYDLFDVENNKLFEIKEHMQWNLKVEKCKWDIIDIKTEKIIGTLQQNNWLTIVDDYTLEIGFDKTIIKRDFGDNSSKCFDDNNKIIATEERIKLFPPTYKLSCNSVEYSHYNLLFASLLLLHNR